MPPFPPPERHSTYLKYRVSIPENIVSGAASLRPTTGQRPYSKYEFKISGPITFGDNERHKEAPLKGRVSLRGRRQQLEGEGKLMHYSTDLYRGPLTTLNCRHAFGIQALGYTGKSLRTT